MGMCTGPMVFELAELTVHAAGDLALAHWLNRCGPGDDESQCGFMRATVGYRRKGDQWQVIHEHWSAPFDMETQKPCSISSPEPLSPNALCRCPGGDHEIPVPGLL